MKTGTKVTIKDGSYMATVKNGQISHVGNFRSTEVIGWCKDTFTLTCNQGNFPGEDGRLVNNHIITNDANGEVWFCSNINIKEVKAESQFKVGDWVYWRGHYPTIGRIEGHCSSFGDSWILTDTGLDVEIKHTSCSSTNLRLATPSEIESHLLKLAKEKGFKEEQHLMSFYADLTPYNYSSGNVVDNTLHYNIKEDSLMTENGLRVYCKGKWATIIPTKKKLPTTKEEFRVVLSDYYRYMEELPFNTTEEFLEKYKD